MRLSHLLAGLPATIRSSAALPTADPDITSVTDDSRTAWLNTQIRQFATANPGKVSLIDLAGFTCPNGTWQETVDGVKLQDDGVHIELACVDDALSVRCLRRLPLHTLRIERATLDRLGARFLETVVVMAQALALRISATEIDSPAALAALEPHVFDDLAGAVIGPAVPASAVLAQSAEPRSTRRIAATGSIPVENTVR